MGAEASASEGVRQGCAGSCAHDHVRSFTQIQATPDQRAIHDLGWHYSGAEVVDPRGCPDWNEQIVSRRGVSVFHSVEWARVLLETYRWLPFYIREGESILPLIEAKTWPACSRGVSLPFSDFCEPIVASEAAAGNLFEIAAKLGRDRAWKYLEIRGGGNRFRRDAPPSATFFSHGLDLRKGEKKLFETFDSSVRRAIRKADQCGVGVSIDSAMPALNDFWRLHVRTRRRHGVPPQPFGFMRRIHEHLLNKGMGFVAVARWHQRPVAACMCLHFGRQAVFKFGASDMAYQYLRGVNAAFWAMIQHLCANGFENLHLGRTEADNQGLRRFKLGWGTTETLLDYSRFDIASGRFIMGSPRRSRRIVERLCACMPVPLLEAVGALLYRHAA